MEEIFTAPGCIYKTMVLSLKHAYPTHQEMVPLRNALIKFAKVLKHGPNTNVLTRQFNLGQSQSKSSTNYQQMDPLELVSMYTKIS